MIRAGQLLNPVGEERGFWSALRQTFDEIGPFGELDFDVWDSFLELARMRGVAAIYAGKDGDRLEFVGPFGFALLARYQWLRDARARGLTHREAEREFSDKVDREREADRKRLQDMALMRARQADEQARKRPATRRRHEEAEI